MKLRNWIASCFNRIARGQQTRASRRSARDKRVWLRCELLEERALLTVELGLSDYVQTNLVSNVAGLALITDPNLVNPWDVNFPQLPGINPPVVVADQGSGVATAYQISSDGSTVIDRSGLTVTIPTVGFSEPSGPTGLVQNTHAGEFLIPGPDGISAPASYIFDTLQGTIEGYNGIMVNSISADTTVNSAEIMVDNNSAGAEYTGLAAGTVNGQGFIYAVNEGTDTGIQVFNDKFKPVTKFGNFIDPDLPAGFIPYGVRDLSLGTHQESDLFVTYRSLNFQGGAVAVFTNDGKFLGQIACDTTPTGRLQSPWGLAFIQHGFGEFSDDLLVGNFSSGQIDAYTVTVVNPKDGKAGMASAVLDGKLLNTNGDVFTIPGLRTIHFGPGLGNGKTHVALLFTAETVSPNGTNLSLYGEITPVPVVNPVKPPPKPPGQPYVVVGNGSGVPLVETAGKNLIIMLESGSGQDIVAPAARSTTTTPWPCRRSKATGRSTATMPATPSTWDLRMIGSSGVLE